MPDDIDIFNEDDDFQRGDDEEDEDDRIIGIITNESEYLQEMHRLMFEHGP